MSHASLFLKLENIPGQSTDAAHKGAIEISSFSMGASKHNGSAHIGEMQCHAVSSTADCKLWKSVMDQKEVIKKVTLTCRAGGSVDYASYTLSDCRITAFSVGGTSSFSPGPSQASGVVLPCERVQFSIAFAKFELESKEIKPDHTLGSPTKFGFDVVANKVI